MKQDAVAQLERKPIQVNFVQNLPLSFVLSWFLIM